MLAAVLGAPTYLWVASRWQRFGVATVSIGILAWLMQLWNRPEWYYQGAAEEIGIIGVIPRIN